MPPRAKESTIISPRTPASNAVSRSPKSTGSASRRRRRRRSPDKDIFLSESIIYRITNIKLNRLILLLIVQGVISMIVTWAMSSAIRHDDNNNKGQKTIQPHLMPSTALRGSTEGRRVVRRVIARPDPLAHYKRRHYDTLDTNMYKKSRVSHRESMPRVVTLGTSRQTRKETVESLASPVSDPTQRYGELDSDDGIVKKNMERREPYSDGECVPMQDWQTTFHPSCNSMHEIGLGHAGDERTGDSHSIFGIKGYWRNAWKTELHTEEHPLVLKTLRFVHNFEDAHFEHDRIDAVAMERLTASPHVINVFGFCGHSVATEYADGKSLGKLADQMKKVPLARLKIARDIAEGLADVHGIDGDGNSTFVHLDINPANVVSVGGRLKLNDFNIGIIQRWNTTSNQHCGFPTQYPNPQWRSPEEARNEKFLTEKVDVFSMGHIFFRLICGHEPWNKLEPGGKPEKAEVNEKVQKGVLPYIPAKVLKSHDPEVIAIREVMLKCYTYDPDDRPSARQVFNMLDEALSRSATEDDTASS